MGWCVWKFASLCRLNFIALYGLESVFPTTHFVFLWFMPPLHWCFQLVYGWIDDFNWFMDGLMISAGFICALTVLSFFYECFDGFSWFYHLCIYCWLQLSLRSGEVGFFHCRGYIVLLYWISKICLSSYSKCPFSLHSSIGL